MNNTEIAGMFDEIAGLLESRKDNIFKVRAYRSAAATILELPESVEQLVKEDRLRDISGVGEAISKKITELVNTGKLEYLTKLKTGISETGDG